MGFDLGSIVSGGLAWLGAEQQNRRAADAAEQAQGFSAQQFATRYQTTVGDMKAAGLNPMLAYSQGGGSPPSGVQAPVVNSASGATSAYFQSKMNDAQIDLIEAQKDATTAQAEKTRAETPWVSQSAMSDIDLKHSSANQAREQSTFLQAQAAKIGMEMRNIPTEGARLQALVENLNESSELMRKQGLTQEQMAVQLKWLARKAMLDGDLVNLDVKAAESLGNLGREAGQLKPLIDIVLQILPRLGRN